MLVNAYTLALGQWQKLFVLLCCIWVSLAFTYWHQSNHSTTFDSLLLRFVYYQYFIHSLSSSILPTPSLSSLTFTQFFSLSLSYLSLYNTSFPICKPFSLSHFSLSVSPFQTPFISLTLHSKLPLLLYLTLHPPSCVMYSMCNTFRFKYPKLPINNNRMRNNCIDVMLRNVYKHHLISTEVSMQTNCLSQLSWYSWYSSPIDLVLCSTTCSCLNIG